MFKQIYNYLFNRTSPQQTTPQEIPKREPAYQSTPQKEKETFDYQPNPIVPRRSEPDSGNYYTIYNGLKELYPDYDLNYLKGISKLVLEDPEVSQAVNNIVLLGNTKLCFDIKGIPEEKKQEIENFCRRQVNKWYASTDKPDDEKSLTADLLVQLATEGCISTEAMLLLDPNEIISIETIPFWQVRINRNEETQELEYTQEPEYYDGENPFYDAGRIELNRLTYRYSPLMTLPNNPYPIPPFLASLKAVAVEQDMFNKVATVIKKLPLTGFLEMLIKKPPIKQGQTQDMYRKETGGLIRKVGDSLRGLFETDGAGAIVGWKDETEYKHHNIVQNIDSVETLSELIDEKKFSGLKQNPFLFGRNTSATETMATVIVQMQEAQIKIYQEKVASCYKYYLDLALGWAGMLTEDLEVVPYFESAFPENEQVKAETFAKNVDSLLKLFDRGLTTSVEMGSILGMELQDVEPEIMNTDEQTPEEAQTREDESEEEN